MDEVFTLKHPAIYQKDGEMLVSMDLIQRYFPTLLPLAEKVSEQDSGDDSEFTE
jgi:hypothetical protein